MAVRWEGDELERSRQRGAWDRWGVHDAERRGEWLCFRFEQRRIYAPLEHLELPHHFAKVASQGEALIRFVEQYGRLGWYELTAYADRAGRPWLQRAWREHLDLIEQFAERDVAVYPEPIEWIHAHARTVAWCLAAGLALRIENARKKTRQCRDLIEQVPTPYGSRGSIGKHLFREQIKDKVAPADFVGGMLQDYLWINLEGVRRRVEYDGSRVRTLWGGDSLLEGIYTLVADAVTNGRLATCQAGDCGAVFIQTDERQRYCPPFDGRGKSTCMNRIRIRRQRSKGNTKQDGVRHGKTPTRKR